MSKSATHTSRNAYLYRIVKPVGFIDNLIRLVDPLTTGVEFWDAHCDKWRPSIMFKSDLFKI